jgi:hypothetical protein
LGVKEHGVHEESCAFYCVRDIASLFPGCHCGDGVALFCWC